MEMEMENVVAVEAPIEHRIPDERWADFQKKFAQLAKRAMKLDVPSGSRVSFTEERRETMVVVQRPNGDEWDEKLVTEQEYATLQAPWRHVGTRTFHVVTVQGDRPKLNGWRFVGTLQSMRDDENNVINILRAAPGESIPAQYRDAPQWCDQCKTRRFRIDTYIVAHDDGRMAQVGSDCLKDFLGHANPESVARFCEYLIELDALGGSFGEYVHGEGSLHLPYILDLTAARVRVKGWMSRSKAREINGEADGYDERVEADYADGTHTTTGRLRRVEATADAVGDYLDKKLGPKRMSRDGVEVTAADLAEAEAALEWIRAQDRNTLQRGDSDYMWNLYAACARSDMSYRTMGIVCSLIAAYQRAMGRERERKERNAQFANSQFVGTVKTREVFRLKLTAEPVHYANDFGGSYLHRLEDEAGNQIVWWASNLIMLNHETREPGEDAQFWAVGDWLNLKATVVKHEERNGIKQTTINRAAIDVPKPPKAKRSKAA
jgi:hypothetical protein